MKFKVGDKIRIIKNDDNDFKIGEIARINNISEDTKYNIFCKSENNYGWVSEQDIKLVKYTWEDFLQAPIGTRVTFEDGDILTKSDANRFDNESECASYNFIESFNREDGFGKIIKIEEPTYTTVYEPQEVTMPEIEEMKRLTDELCKTCDEFIKKIKEKE